MVHPIVGLIAVIGVGLSLLGTAAVSFLTYNDFEDFARRCFLAKQKNLTPQVLSWSTKAFQLPAEEILTEVAVLHHLWCTFAVELERDADDALLMLIRPGLFGPDSLFELHVVRHYWDPRAMLNPMRLRPSNREGPSPDPETHKANLLISPADGTIEQSVGVPGLAAVRLGSPGAGVQRDADGTVRRIRVGLEYEPMPKLKPAWSPTYCEERLPQSRAELNIRFLMDGQHRKTQGVPPVDDTWLSGGSDLAWTPFRRTPDPVDPGETRVLAGKEMDSRDKTSWVEKLRWREVDWRHRR